MPEALPTLSDILAAHRLTLIREDLLGRAARTTVLVRDQHGRTMLLKRGGVNPQEEQLHASASRLGASIRFRVPALVASGQGYLLRAFEDGALLKERYAEDADACIEISSSIAADYQRVLAGVALGDPADEGRRWQHEKLRAWFQPILDAGLAAEDDRDRLGAALRRVEDEGSVAYAWTHGNIHGEHVVLPEDGGSPVLIDLDAKPRLGGATYDLLRSIDFTLLEAADDERAAADAERWIARYVPEQERDAARVIFAVRCVGLCWDILDQHARPDMPNRAGKLAMLLRFVAAGTD